VEFVDFEDKVPDGKYTLGKMLAMCLRKTGLDLNIRVINNLRHGSGEVTVTTTDVGFTAPDNIILISAEFAYFFYQGQTFTVTGTASNDGTYTVLAVAQTAIIGLFFVLVAEDLTAENVTNVTFTDTSSATHIYAGTYLDAKTFETNIGEREDCYSVLSKILGEDCYLTQYKGEWWIVRIDEVEALPVYVALFNSEGEYQSISEEDYTKSIGSAEDHRFANADQLLYLGRPHGFIKETFRFQYPQEIICNIDYSRGDETDDPDVQETGYTSYELDCWEAKRLWGSDAEAAQIKAAILRKFNTLGGGEERFIMLTQPTTNEDAFNYIESSPVPMWQQDRFRFTFDISAMTNPSGDGLITACYVLLYATSGNIYTLDTLDTSASWINTDGEVPLAWRETNENFTLFRGGLQWAMFTSEDKTVWQPCTILAPPLPEAGDLRFMLCAADQSDDSFDSFNVRYQNINIEYLPFINGSYRKYTGQYNKVSREEEGYLAKREREVYIADSPNPQFKGSLLIASGSGYTMTTRWYTANTFALGYPTSSGFLHTYGRTQAFAVWNQHRLVVRRIDGSILGFGSSWPDVIHKYVLTDSNPNVNNRYFMMMSYEQDWKMGIMTAIVMEVYKTDDGHVYTDEHEFKYISE
jgi:hypothetical protein